MLIPLLIFTSCSKPEKTGNEPYLFLDSVLSLKILDDDVDKDKITSDVRKRLETIENEMSTHLASSDISKVNSNAGVKPVPVSEDILDLLSITEKYVSYTKNNPAGRFDIRIYPVVKLWDIGGSGERVPNAQELSDALAKVNSKMTVDRKNKTIYLEQKGMGIDLGGCAKGYADDEIVKILNENGVKSAIIDLGGNIYVHGSKAGKTFKVAIQDPQKSDGYIGVLDIKDSSVVTSGIYERFFEKDGVCYHHILSTTDGYPVNNGLVSVSVIGKSSTVCDIMSTSLFLLGQDKGLETANQIPDIEAVFLNDKGEIYLTDGAKKIFTKGDNSYKVAN